MRLFVLALAVVGVAVDGGCQRGDGLVVVEVVASDVGLPPLSKLAVQVLASSTKTFDLGQSVVLPTSFGLQMPRTYSGLVSVNISAVGADGTIAGYGSGQANVSPGKRTDMQITVDKLYPWPGDGGAAFDDMTSVGSIDMASSAVGDLAIGADLAAADMTSRQGQSCTSNDQCPGMGCSCLSGNCTNGMGTCNYCGTEALTCCIGMTCFEANHSCQFQSPNYICYPCGAAGQVCCPGNRCQPGQGTCQTNGRCQ